MTAMFTWLLLTISTLNGAFLSGRNIETGKQLEIAFTNQSPYIVAVFVSAKCPCSASHEKVLRELYKKYSQNGFQFIGIHSNVDESEEGSRNYFANQNFLFPIIQDDQAKLADRFGALKTPHVFVINKDGKIEYQGGVDNSHSADAADIHFLADALDDLSQGRKVRIRETRSLGCLIERP